MESLNTILSHLAHKTYADVTTLGLITLGTIGFAGRGKLWDRQDPYHHLWFEKPQEKHAGSSGVIQNTRNIAQKLQEHGKQLVVFWGSQSGTAESFATRLVHELHSKYSLEAMTADLSDYDASSIMEIPGDKFAIFIVSTFGDGDPSDNTASFWEWIQGPPDGKSLANLQYMAFGLGNSNYKYYNRVVDVVVAALDQIGANAILPQGKADDANGATEEDFIAWKDDVFACLQSRLGLEERNVQYEPIYEIVEDGSLDTIDLHHGVPTHMRGNAKAATAMTAITPLQIKNARELFEQSSNRNCLHVDFDLSDHPEVHYKTGDHLGVWPMNEDGEVERLLAVLGLDQRRDIPLLIKSLDASVKVKVPTPMTATTLFRYHLEIAAPVSRDSLLSLAAFAPTLEAQLCLTQLGKSKEAYAQYQERNTVTLARLLEKASGPGVVWEKLPLSFVVETLAPIQPRYYSISSSSVTSPRTPSITAVVSTKDIQGSQERVFGLTTNYILALKHSLTEEGHPHGLNYTLSGPENALQSGKVHVHVRKSKFKLPVLASHPIVMVAAGTGIAPFRAFITERARLKTMGKEVGRMMLFFGCRHPEQDYLYREELQSLQHILGEETLTIVTAFSRQSEKKVYVQNRVAEHGGELCDLLLERNANFYICGSAAMAREVSKSVQAVVCSGRDWDDEEWSGWKSMKTRSNKWQEDVWG